MKVEKEVTIYVESFIDALKIVEKMNEKEEGDDIRNFGSCSLTG